MTDAPNSNLHSGTGRPPRAALAAIAIGLGGLAFATMSSDRDFSSGLERALAVRAAGSDRMAVIAQAGQPPVVGSEDYWLTRTPAGSAAVAPVAFVPGIDRGDRYEFAGAGGKRILEVIDVRPLDAALAGLTSQTGTVDSPQLLVSFRDVASDGAAAIRMLVDANAPLVGLTPISRRQHRAL